MAAKKKTRVATKIRRHQSRVTADTLDFRDCLYAPPIGKRPPPELLPARKIPVLDQGETGACTGFATADVVHWLSRRARRLARGSQVQDVFHARRYDSSGSKADTPSIRARSGWA